MTGLVPIKIDHSGEFEHLVRAPIIEAVVEFRTRATIAWDHDELRDRLQRAVPEYPTIKAIHGFSVTVPFEFTPGPAESADMAKSGPAQQERSWIGFRLESQDGRQIAVFTRDNFYFSRLRPYEDWNRFNNEAMRLWRIHVDLARPEEIQRLGVRFINRFEIPITASIDDFLSGFSVTAAGLPVSQFLHRDVLAVPGHPYQVNLVRTIQVPEVDPPVTLGLILDIDVFGLEPLVPAIDRIQQRLADMRWLKNSVFFGSVTEKALDLCR